MIKIEKVLTKLIKLFLLMIVTVNLLANFMDINHMEFIKDTNCLKLV